VQGAGWGEEKSSCHGDDTCSHKRDPRESKEPACLLEEEGGGGKGGAATVVLDMRRWGGSDGETGSHHGQA
jgi:hypothetical protein